MEVVKAAAKLKRQRKGSNSKKIFVMSRTAISAANFLRLPVMKQAY
jgi:hypothetical protein